MSALSVAAILFLSSAALTQTGQLQHPISEYPAPAIREEQSVTVDGVIETWRLQWAARPAPYCGANERDLALTCPCMGFAYGEVGDLYLVRVRNGTEIDRLHLTPLFGEHPAAVVQHWPVDDEKDFKLSERNDFARIVSQRPTVKVMNFADYDHGGRSTEFYLQTEAAPCGKSLGVVIGLSKSDPMLHVFGTVSNPKRPLYLQKHEWEALREASSVPVKILDWACGDHGSPNEMEVELVWSAQGIDGVRREYTCPSGKEARKLIGEEPLPAR